MRLARAFPLYAGTMVLLPLLAGAAPGPTRVRLFDAAPLPTPQSLSFRGPAEVRPSPIAYGSPDSGATPEILGRVGEILGAIDNPERRSKLAEQWLQYSKQVIAKEQEARDKWLQLQQQQLEQQEQTGRLQLEIAQLQMKIEELHAENLRLQQENLRIQRQLSPAGGRTLPRPSLPASPDQ